ncbi:MAG TPA: condensation domain-containing protein, partial [Planctomycetota bacterium]|nr:condensation domain-containing protein [Planctomycetota bacterium]
DQIVLARPAREQGFWRERLAGAADELQLPADVGRRPAPRGLAARRRAPLPAETAARLRAWARARGASPFMAWLAAFGALLARWTGQDDLIVGIPVSGRDSVDAERTVGFLVNTVPVRARLGDDPSFTELLARARAAVLDALAHQALPFDRVVEAVTPTRAPIEVDTGAAKFDLSVTLEEGDGETTVLVEYDVDLFTPVAIDALLARWPVLLSGLLAAPERPCSAIPWLPEAESRRIAIDWNDTGRRLPAEGGLAALFAEQVARRADAVAVSEGSARLTYAGLDRRAERLAAQLRDLGVGPDVPVAVCLARGIDLVVALVGVIKAGGAYMPLDPEHPAERLRFAIEDAGAAAVVAAAGVDLGGARVPVVAPGLARADTPAVIEAGGAAGG